MTLHVHPLKGCSPTPLANYLKALGVLRLVVEQQADADARGWWQGEQFCLLSQLTREELEEEKGGQARLFRGSLVRLRLSRPVGCS